MSFGIPVRNGLGVGLLASTSLATRRGTAPPAAAFAVLNAAGVSYTVTRNVLDASGASFAVPQAVLAADGTSYTVI